MPVGMLAGKDAMIGRWTDRAKYEISDVRQKEGKRERGKKGEGQVVVDEGRRWKR
jgi:hypothetical protein